MNSVKVEDRFDGASNFNSWKSRVLIILEDNFILRFVNGKVPKPKEEEDKSQWKKSDAKARSMLIDFVQDCLIPQISQKKTTKKMFDALKKLFENNNINRALALRQQLSNIKMTRVDSITS